MCYWYNVVILLLMMIVLLTTMTTLKILHLLYMPQTTSSFLKNGWEEADGADLMQIYKGMPTQELARCSSAIITLHCFYMIFQKNL